MSYFWVRGYCAIDRDVSIIQVPLRRNLERVSGSVITYAEQTHFSTQRRNNCLWNGTTAFVPVTPKTIRPDSALVELDGQFLWIERQNLFVSLMKNGPISALELLKDEPQMSADNKVYETGAQRSKDVEHVRYDLFHPIFMERVGAVLAEGAEKYGEHNWEQGFPMNSLFNHLLVHAYKYLGGDRTEDHLGHMGCNIMFLIVESEMRYERNLSHLRGPGCQLTDEMRAEIERFRTEKAEMKKMKGDVDSLIDRLSELTLTGTLRESRGSLELSKLQEEFFSDIPTHELISILTNNGFTISNDQIQGVELDRGMVARIRCCKKGSPESVEAVDHIIKLLQGGAYSLDEELRCSMAQVQSDLGKPFKLEELVHALRAYQLRVINHEVWGLGYTAATEGQVDPKDIGTVVKTLLDSTICKNPRSAIHLRHLVEKLPKEVDQPQLMAFFQDKLGATVMYIPQEQDHTIFGYGWR